MQNSTPRPPQEYRAAASRALRGNWPRTLGLILLARICSVVLPFIVICGYNHWLNSWLQSNVANWFSVINNNFSYPYQKVYLVIYFLSYLPVLFVLPGQYFVLAQPYLGKSPRLSDAFAGFHHPLHTLCTMLLFTLRWMLTLLLCLLPSFSVLIAGKIWAPTSRVSALLYLALSLIGIIAAIIRMLYYAPTPPLIVTHPELNARDTLRHSRQIMQGRRWAMVKLNLSLFIPILLNIIAMLLVRSCFSVLTNQFPSLQLFISIAFTLLAQLIPIAFMLKVFSANVNFLLDADGVNIFGDALHESNGDGDMADEVSESDDFSSTFLDEDAFNEADEQCRKKDDDTPSILQPLIDRIRNSRL